MRGIDLMKLVLLVLFTIMVYTITFTITDIDINNNRDINFHVLNPEKDLTKFLNYKIIKSASLPYKVKAPKCMDGVHNGIRVFDESFKEPGILDFDTQIETNLNILYVGSSIGDQLAQSLQGSSQTVKREVIRYAWKWYHENTHISLTSRGGTVSGLRVTGLMSNKNRDSPSNMAPMPGGGWLTYDVRELKRMVNQWQKIVSISGSSGQPTSPCEVLANKNITTNSTASAESDFSCAQKNFDSVIHQFPVEWLGDRYMWMFTSSYIDEIVSLSFKELGVNTIIL